MTTVISEKRIENWQLDKLKPHSKQSQIFQPAPAEEIEKLANLMKTQPSTSVVEVLPDGTIVCGHSRAQAARQLGWTEIEVWVREDLHDQGSAAVERRLIEDNFVRRQLSPLDQARCIKALFELEKNAKKGSKGKGNLRDLIAEKHNMSGRNLERYLNVLKTPMEVQQAFDQEKLSLDEASRVAGMTAVKQQEVVNAIAHGKKVREVIRDLVEQKEDWTYQPGNNVTTYLRPLQNWNWKMKNRLPKIASVTSHDLETITKTIGYLNDLAKKAEPPKSDDTKEISQPESVKEIQDPVADRPDSAPDRLTIETPPWATSPNGNTEIEAKKPHKISKRKKRQN